MSGATMALLECIKDSEHYLVHTLDSVLIKHAVVEALEKIAFLRARVEVLEGALRLSQEWTDTMIDYCGRYLESHPANTDRYNPERFVSFILESLDGPAQRKAYEAARAALAGGGKDGE